MELPGCWGAGHNRRGYGCRVASPMVNPSVHIRTFPDLRDGGFGWDRQRFWLVARLVDDGQRSQPSGRIVVGSGDAYFHPGVWSGGLQERT